MKYKISIYTKRLVINSQIFLYNTFTDKLLALSVDVDKIIDNNVEHLEDIANVHNHLFTELLCNKFIVPYYVEEWKDVVNVWKKEDSSLDKFTIIVNPTLNCNMRCWYCYEKHNAQAYMTDDVLERIFLLVHRKVSMEELKGFNIDFFGGEPLLHYKNCVLPILHKAYQECVKFNKQLFVSFTTNAYLLSDKVLNELKLFSKWGDINFQITLDGNNFFHDKTRALGGSQSTYRIIIDNIHKSINNGYRVLVRLNYTDKNILSFYDVIEDFTNLSMNAKQKLSFSLHKVWQETDTPELNNKVKMIADAIKNEGFCVDSGQVLTHSRCYADRDNCVVINYNGDIYKCTARDFVPEAREGILSENGEIEWNDKYKYRNTIKYGYDKCHNCVIYPLCHAACSQVKLETEDNGCIKHLTERDKDEIIKNKVKSILINKENV